MQANIEMKPWIEIVYKRGQSVETSFVSKFRLETCSYDQHQCFWSREKNLCQLTGTLFSQYCNETKSSDQRHRVTVGTLPIWPVVGHTAVLGSPHDRMESTCSPLGEWWRFHRPMMWGSIVMMHVRLWAAFDSREKHHYYSNVDHWHMHNIHPKIFVSTSREPVSACRYHIFLFFPSRIRQQQPWTATDNHNGSEDLPSLIPISSIVWLVSSAKQGSYMYISKP